MRTSSRSTVPALLAGLAAVAVALVLLMTALPAFAGNDGPGGGGDDREIRREGTCSASTRWKVKAKEDDGRVEFEGEIDSNRRGQTWRWVIKHNGWRSAGGTRRTRGPSGSFEVERVMTDASGLDTFTFRARNLANREVCVGSIAW